MTKTDLIKMLDALKDDVDYMVTKTKIFVTLNDFDGFDSDWNEIFRDYDDTKAVTNFLNTLKAKAVTYYGDFYTYYVFDDFMVCLGYASYDI